MGAESRRPNFVLFEGWSFFTNHLMKPSPEGERLPRREWKTAVRTIHDRLVEHLRNCPWEQPKSDFSVVGFRGTDQPAPAESGFRSLWARAFSEVPMYADVPFRYRIELWGIPVEPDKRNRKLYTCKRGGIKDAQGKTLKNRSQFARVEELVSIITTPTE